MRSAPRALTSRAMTMDDLRRRFIERIAHGAAQTTPRDAFALACFRPRCFDCRAGAGWIFIEARQLVVDIAHRRFGFHEDVRTRLDAWILVQRACGNDDRIAALVR